MKYILYLAVLSLPMKALAQNSLELELDLPTIKIRKSPLKVPFEDALLLSNTATSCDCPSNSNTPLIKLGCQHPDTVAVCKVVITQFDMAIIPRQGDPIILKEIQGSFLNSFALGVINSLHNKDYFISYTNIKGMTEDGKEVVVPSFGTEAPYQRANRDYIPVYNYISTTDTKIQSFELVAYNAENQMVFRQSYQKDSFDKNAMRPDATRYIFKNIKGKHSSGVEMEIGNFEINYIEPIAGEWLSSN